MINVNFFEKKKVNILPHIVGGVFLVSLVLMAGYFFVTRTGLEKTIKQNNEWMQAHAEEVALSRRISRVDDLIGESNKVQATISDNQYPMFAVAEGIAAVVPNELEQIATFTLSDPSQVTLNVENTDAKAGQRIVENLEDLPYVTEVQFLHAETQGSEENKFRFEFIITLDIDRPMEEDTE